METNKENEIKWRLAKLPYSSQLKDRQNSVELVRVNTMAVHNCTCLDLNLDFDDGGSDGQLSVVGRSRSQLPRLERHVDMSVLNQSERAELLSAKWYQPRTCVHEEHSSSPWNKPICDNYNLNSHKYVCITTYQPDTKSNPNHNPKPNSKQHRNSEHSAKYVPRIQIYIEFIRVHAVAPSVLL